MDLTIGGDPAWAKKYKKHATRLGLFLGLVLTPVGRHGTARLTIFLKKKSFAEAAHLIPTLAVSAGLPLALALDPLQNLARVL